MGLRRFSGFAIVFFAAIFSISLHAQFQEPTREELQMTMDPKAPGASAVYLYFEDITDQLNFTRSYYARIKVLADKGKELATVRIPYEPGEEKIAQVEARTIHADGTVVPFTDKPTDLMDVKTKGFQLNTLVFTLPSVDVGSILEYRIKIRYPQGVGYPTWMIQKDYFIHKAHYFFKPSEYRQLSWFARIPAEGKIITDKKGYTLDLADIPALPDDDWMPPLNTINWRVSFFYTYSKTTADYWQDAGKYWGNAVYEAVNPNAGLKKAVSEIVAPGDTESQKAQKIYAAVMKLDNTDFTREKSKAERKQEKIKDVKNVEDIWKQKSGSADDIALLYIALARAAGLKVDPVEVVDRSRALFDENVLSSRQLDDYIAVAQLDGKDIFLDPGEKWCPFGTLDWRHNLTSGFRLVDKQGAIVHTPSASFTNSITTRVADLTVDANGEVTGTLRFVLTGQSALNWRQIALQNDEEEVKKQFNESVRSDIPDGVQADFDHFVGLGDFESDLMGIVRISGNLGTVTGKRLILPGLFFESRAKHPFVTEEKRTIPVDVHYPGVEIDNVSYHLPAGFTVETTPSNAKLAWPGHALFQVESKQTGDTVNVARKLTSAYTILDPKDYSTLHDFYQKVAEGDQQQLVLTRVTAAGEVLTHNSE